MLPGFIDGYTHFVSGGFQLMSVDSRKEYPEKNPGRWITGGNWEHELPRKEWIDWFMDIWGLQVHFKICRYNTRNPRSTRRFDRER